MFLRNIIENLLYFTMREYGDIFDKGLCIRMYACFYSTNLWERDVIGLLLLGKMTGVHVICAIAIFIAMTVMMGNSTGVAAPAREFSAEESCEFLDLLIWGGGFRDGFLQNVKWDDSQTGSCRTGWVGVLFERAMAKSGATWEQGVMSRVELCQPGEGKRLELGLSMSPLYIEKRLTGRVAEFQPIPYLRQYWESVSELWSRGRSGWGEKAYSLERSGIKVWLILRTEHGLNGQVGTTNFLLFGSQGAAEKDSETEKHY